jgi:acetolactate synthase-1/2/3 large subunit
MLEVVRDAFRSAMAGRPGPGLTDVPKDVQNQLITIDEGELPAPAVADPAPPLDTVAIEAAAQMINAAEQPVLYLGGGVVASSAAPLAVRPRRW